LHFLNFGCLVLARAFNGFYKKKAFEILSTATSKSPLLILNVALNDTQHRIWPLVYSGDKYGPRLVI